MHHHTVTEIFHRSNRLSVVAAGVLACTPSHRTAVQSKTELRDAGRALLRNQQDDAWRRLLFRLVWIAGAEAAAVEAVETLGDRVRTELVA